MGLLVGENSQTLPFPESRKVQRLLKHNAAFQLAKMLRLFEGFAKSPADALKFGTELECHLLRRVNLHHHPVYSVYIDSKPVMAEINHKFPDTEVKEEFSAWMMEFIPKTPFRLNLSLNEIRAHFRYVHHIADAYEGKLTLLPGLSVLPHIGTPNYYIKDDFTTGTLLDRRQENPYSHSDFFLDSTITQHSRFRTFTANTRLRHGEKPEIVLPILKDKLTPKSQFSLDHFGFGMCNTALQITYSCRDLKQARFAHDMMHVLSPFMLVFSSTTFAVSHHLLDLDNRFNIIEQSTDDRKPREKPALDKTRYSTINFYLSDSPKLRKEHNDKKPAINKRFFKQLRNLLRLNGSKLAKDKRLLIHFAYLFVRDYLIVFPERVTQKGYREDSLDFEAIQSSNWHNMRLKPPSSFDSDLGWLLEFRCMDSPLTEIEKSLMTFVVTLFFRIVCDERLDLDFYIPISLVDENYRRSFQRDAITKQKFFFRKHFCPLVPGYQRSQEVVELTMAEFMGGREDFAGMGALFQAYISLNEKELLEASKSQKEDVIGTVWKVHAFLSARATGQLQSTPNFFREFVFNHKNYKRDSYLDDCITTDLLDKAVELSKRNDEKALFGDFTF